MEDGGWTKIPAVIRSPKCIKVANLHYRIFQEKSDNIINKITNCQHWPGQPPPAPLSAGKNPPSPPSPSPTPPSPPPPSAAGPQAPDSPEPAPQCA